MPIDPHVAEPDGFGGCNLCPLPPGNSTFHIRPELAPRTVRPPNYTPAAVALDAPETSAVAAAFAEKGRGHVRRVIRILLANGVPMTDWDLEQAIPAILGHRDHWHQTVSAARNALVADGLVEQARDDAGDPIVKTTGSGRNAMAWTLTPLGKAAAA